MLPDPLVYSQINGKVCVCSSYFLDQSDKSQVINLIMYFRILEKDQAKAKQQATRNNKIWATMEKMEFNIKYLVSSKS